MRIRTLISGSLALAAMLFAQSCGDKNEPEGLPEINLSKNVIEFQQEASSETIKVASTRQWFLSNCPEWIAVDPESGKDPNGMDVTISVLGNTGLDREAALKFSIGYDTKTLTVKQKGTGSAADAIVYANDFDKTEATKTFGTGSSWPYLDQFDGWKNASGTGIGAETYSFSGMSARANSTSNSNYSDYEGSGSNNLFFGSSAYFSIQGIKLPSDVNYSLTFGAEKYNKDNGSLFKHDEFHVYVSNDAKKWVEIEYTFPSGDKEGRWDLATSNFTVPNGTSSLSIYVKTDVASSYRLDDLKLSVAAEAGTVIDFSKGVDLGTGGGDNPGPATEMKISEVLSSPSGTAAIVTGTVAATYQRGFVITDGADYLLVYDGTKCAAKEKDNVKVSGTTSEYGGLIQLASPEVTVVSSGNALTLPSPKVLDAAAFDAYSSSKIEYISYEGTLSVSGNYVNVEVAGATKHTGSLAYINDSFNAKSFDGAVVKVTGFYVGLASNNKYVNTMVTDLVPGASDYLTVSTTSLSAAADATSATFEVKANVAWTVTSDNSAYIVEPASGDKNATITVKFAANTEEADKVVKLTVSTKADVATKSHTVTLTHRGKSSSSGSEMTLVIADDNAWTAGSDGTYGKGYEYTKDGIKFGYYKYKSTSDATAPKEDHIRIYKNSVFVVIPPTGKKVEKVVLNCYSDKCSNMTVLSDNTIAVSDATNNTVTWTGSVDTFAAQADIAQIRAKSITVVLK